jgi:hypothetical protein
VDQLLEWLRGYQLEDQDFIRQIIIDGLEAFRVRLKHLGWLGWGYTVQSLQEVLTAYMVIERQQPFASPSMEALYKKTTAFLKKTAQTITSAKAVVEATRFSLEFYAVLAATQHGAPAAAKAALTFFGLNRATGHAFYVIEFLRHNRFSSLTATAARTRVSAQRRHANVRKWRVSGGADASTLRGLVREPASRARAACPLGLRPE